MTRQRAGAAMTRECTAAASRRGVTGSARMRSIHSERGQALLLVLVVALLIAVAGAFLFAYGQALGSRGRYQRVADLAVMSAARVMRTSYPRLFEPPVLPDGVPNPMYMSKPQYLALARAAAGSAAVRNGTRLGLGDVTFPDGLSFAPTRVRVTVRRAVRVRMPSFAGRRSGTVPVAATATAAITPSIGGAAGGGAGERDVLELAHVHRIGQPIREDRRLEQARIAGAHDTSSRDRSQIGDPLIAPT